MFSMLRKNTLILPLLSQNCHQQNLEYWTGCHLYEYYFMSLRVSVHENVHESDRGYVHGLARECGHDHDHGRDHGHRGPRQVHRVILREEKQSELK